MVLALCTSSNVDGYLYEVFLKIARAFSSYRAARVCDGQSSKENNLKSIKARVMVLMFCTSSSFD